mmetsp:Transcript_3186/g.4836  ORF Transcript_3186/g.4836 Transcript_3186/m.4836 type:complete len:321 (+) Transcript_3186:30-992(+)
MMIVVTLLLSFLACSIPCIWGQVIAGYLPDYRSYINVNNTAILLTDLILFSVEPSADGTLEGQCCLGSSHYQLAREASSSRVESSKSALKIWITVGGAGRSEGFRTFSKSQAGRDAFVSNLLQLCKKEGLNGVDIDWQDIKDESEYENFIQLILAASKALHEEGMLLSVSTRQRLPPHVLEEIDRAHFMGYDLIINGGPKHHASYSIVTQMIDQWIDWGFPEEKIVLGIPGYARHKDSPAQIKTVSELIDDGLDDDTLEEYNGYLYDSPKLIRKKMKYVKQNGLCGVVLWELGHDKQMKDQPGGWLLHAIASKRTKKEEL